MTASPPMGTPGRITALLVREAGIGSFMQAGGKIETAEDAWSALRREAREEMGLGRYHRSALPRLLLGGGCERAG